MTITGWMLSKVPFAGSLLAYKDETFWLPSQSSTIAPRIDFLFDFIMWLSIFFTVLITGLGIWFLLKYRQRDGHESPQPSPSHNVPLELLWSGIPLLIVMFIFYDGWTGYLDARTPPGDAYEIHVTGQKWSWSFLYPKNGYIDNELHVPVDTNIRLIMSSEDVLHSFFIPAFRQKMDVVPGRYNDLWFIANEPGEYRIYCTEYCGTEHSSMLSKVIVHPTESQLAEGGLPTYEEWLEEASNFVKNLPPIEAGQKLYETRGCTQCHSVDGSKGIGPSFKEIQFGQSRPLQGGGTVVWDEEYIRESILNSKAKIAAGYEPVMPSYDGRFKTEELTVLIEYMKSLNSSE